MSSLIEINDPALADRDTIIIDARAGQDSYQRYLAGHLKNAIYADLDRHLTTKPENPAYGGRHPLPNIQEFAVTLGNWGITPASRVVVYDDKSGAFAASRLWWMLRAIGHENVQVLNGGLAAAKNAGVELSTETYTPAPVDPYPVTHEYAGTVNLEEVGEAARDSLRVVIDVRETPRYLGHTEPLDLIAGHIPGAINLPYTNNLDAEGKYLSSEELRKAYDAAIGDVAHNQIVVHCGSGVTACHTLLGLDYAGISGPKLYVGSWSEWSRRDLPIAKEEQ